MHAPSRATGVLHGAPIVRAVKEAGVSHVLSVPDIHTAGGLLTPIRSDPDFTLIRTCKEDETFGIGIERHYIDVDEDVAKIAPAIRRAYEHSHPVAMLIGRKPI